MSNAWEPQTQRGFALNIVLWFILAAAVIGITVLGGWRLGWWMQGKATNYQAHIIRNSYGNQQTLREQITQKLADVSTITVQLSEVNSSSQEYAALRVQRIAIAAIVCQDAEQVVGDPLPTDQGAWIAVNCLNGGISSSSALNY